MWKYLNFFGFQIFLNMRFITIKTYAAYLNFQLCARNCQAIMISKANETSAFFFFFSFMDRNECHRTNIYIFYLSMFSLILLWWFFYIFWTLTLLVNIVLIILVKLMLFMEIKGYLRFKFNGGNVRTKVLRRMLLAAIIVNKLCERKKFIMVHISIFWSLMNVFRDFFIW